MTSFVALILSLSVIDGDTLHVTARAWPGIVVDERVRLLGVDAAEPNAASACERDMALRSTQWVRERTGAANVKTLHATGRDGFGRVLGRVDLDGVDLGRAMLAAGVARPYGVRGAWC